MYFIAFIYSFCIPLLLPLIIKCHISLSCMFSTCFQFAHALGSGRQQSTVQTTKTKSSQWYAHDADDQTGVNSAGVPKKEEFIQEVKRTQKSSFNCK